MSLFGEYGKPEIGENYTKYPEYFPAGQDLVGVIIGLRDNGPVNKVLSKTGGRDQYVINYRFRIVGGPNHGFTCNGSIWLPIDENGWHGEQRDLNRVGRVLRALGIEPETWPVPLPNEIADMVNGVGKWEGKGWTFKVVEARTGAPQESQNGKIYTNLRFLNPVANHVSTLLADDVEAVRKKVHDDAMKAEGVNTEDLDSMFAAESIDL